MQPLLLDKGAKNPAVQFRQAVALFGMAEYFPGGHCSHAVNPGSALKDAAGQAVHCTEPVALAKDPAGQGEQLLLNPGEKYPALHE